MKLSTQQPIFPGEILIRKLESIAELSAIEKQAIAGLPFTVKSLPEDEAVFREEETARSCCLLLKGFMHRYQDLLNGGRQIMSFHLPGDIVDLQTLHIGEMDHSVGTISACEVAFIPHAALLDLTNQYPGINAALWRASLIEAAIFRQWIVNVGRRDAYQRIGHLFCELMVLMRSAGLAEEDGYMLPLTQAEIADATGMTTVHVNRTLKELRGDGLIATEEQRFLRILDWEALRTVAGFDPAYLHHRG